VKLWQREFLTALFMAELSHPAAVHPIYKIDGIHIAIVVVELHEAVHDQIVNVPVANFIPFATVPIL
jgi:hypothetical protein